MRVDKIIGHGKTKSKVIFDDGFTLCLYNGEIAKWHIIEDGEVTEAFYEGTILPVLDKRARERLVNILKDSDKPEAKLREKLREGAYPQSCIDNAIAWAKSKHYVDDERYVDTYLRYHSDGKSRKLLMYDLMQKGIDKELILRMLDEIEVDEDAQVRKELARRGYEPGMDQKEKQKIIAALARKGYSWATINNACHMEMDS